MREKLKDKEKSRLPGYQNENIRKIYKWISKNRPKRAVDIFREPLRTYTRIVLFNLVPLIGFIFFHWQMMEIFLYYCAELCAFEFSYLFRTMIFWLRLERGGLGKSVLSAVFSTFWVIVGNMVVFTITLMCLYSVADPGDGFFNIPSRKIITDYVQRNYPAILFMFSDYFADFISYVKRKTDILSDNTEIVIYVYIAIVVGIVFGYGFFAIGNGLTSIFSGSVPLDDYQGSARSMITSGGAFQVLMLVLMIVVKTVAQFYKHSQKNT